MPQPMSTPTMLGDTLSETVIEVPIVHPAPACTSGMMRILSPAYASVSQRALICSSAPSSIRSVNTFTSLYLPRMIFILSLPSPRPPRKCNQNFYRNPLKNDQKQKVGTDITPYFSAPAPQNGAKFSRAASACYAMPFGDFPKSYTLNDVYNGQGTILNPDVTPKRSPAFPIIPNKICAEARRAGKYSVFFGCAPTATPSFRSPSDRSPILPLWRRA